MRRLVLFLAGSLALWTLVAIPARFIWGDWALVYSGTALALCLAPTTVTLLWSAWAFQQAPEHQLAMVLGGTGLRMFVVLAAGLVLYNHVEYFQNHPGFWTWVLVCYLVTLALEVALMLSGRQAVDQK